MLEAKSPEKGLISESSLYAAVDLGSNSFHLLVIRNTNSGIQVLDRLKKKVRLAAGLSDSGYLSEESMERGWQCLAQFAERLYGIPPEHIRIVATAALRAAQNAQRFISIAQTILNLPIDVIHGEEEAKLIYQGVNYTTGGNPSRLVVDIGGASTELIVGNGDTINSLVSLPMGCVTWLERYFADRSLNVKNFHQAETAAREQLALVAHGLTLYGWKACVGASGTIQALQEIMLAQGMDEAITLDKLLQLKVQAIQCGKLEELEIEGLTLERALVFPSGLAILIAIFDTLKVDGMALSGGALREGLVYDMLPRPSDRSVRQRTVRALQALYRIDLLQADLVSQQADRLCSQLENDITLNSDTRELLFWACQLHEIGLSIAFKDANRHAAYLLNHIDAPGFTPSQKRLLATLLLNQTHALNIQELTQQNALESHQVIPIARLLRIAILLCRTRHPDAIPPFSLSASNETFQLKIDALELKKHPLLADALHQESRWQTNCRLPLNIQS
ncbi:guanosine-5'-triphosphate,3'-diphosphate pyrophosphatase [Leminorella grimontii]|nr:guanosine-5'-triphosphate,3'-diphosphate pyrophosphatase [Leminorella grimontii]